MEFFEIGDDVILMDIIGRISIEGEDGNYTLSFFDRNNVFITDIGYEDECVGESYRDDFIEYLNKK